MDFRFSKVASRCFPKPFIKGPSLLRVSSPHRCTFQTKSSVSSIGYTFRSSGSCMFRFKWFTAQSTEIYYNCVNVNEFWKKILCDDANFIQLAYNRPTVQWWEFGVYNNKEFLHQINKNDRRWFAIRQCLGYVVKLFSHQLSLLLNCYNLRTQITEYCSLHFSVRFSPDHISL